MEADLLTNPELVREYLEMGWPVITSLILATVILAIGWMGSKWAEKLVLRALHKTHVHEELTRFLGRLASWAVLIVAAIGALGRMGIATASLLTVLASAGLAIGLALKGTLSNFASGVVLLVFRPFGIGDNVEVQGVSGAVHDIGLWATTLHAWDGTVAVIPNAELTDQKIFNRTRRGQRRVQVDIGVAYGTPMDRARSAIRAAIDAVPQGLADPAPDVRFVSFDASAVTFRALVWVEAAEYVAAEQALADALVTALEDADIGIPFDQLVVHHETPLRLLDDREDEDRAAAK